MSDYWIEERCVMAAYAWQILEENPFYKRLLKATNMLSTKVIAKVIADEGWKWPTEYIESVLEKNNLYKRLKEMPEMKVIYKKTIFDKIREAVELDLKINKIEKIILTREEYRELMADPRAMWGYSGWQGDNSIVLWGVRIEEEKSGSWTSGYVNVTIKY